MKASIQLVKIAAFLSLVLSSITAFCRAAAPGTEASPVCIRDSRGLYIEGSQEKWTCPHCGKENQGSRDCDKLHCGYQRKEVGSSIFQKNYIDPHNVYVDKNGMYVLIGDTWTKTDELFRDQQGFYLEVTQEE